MKVKIKNNELNGVVSTAVVEENGIKNTKIYLNDINLKALAEKAKNNRMENTTFMVSTGIAKERFGYAGHADLVRVPLKVDVEKLSDLGKIIAYSIPTFENGDTLSNLRCYGPKQRELMVKENYSDEHIDKIEKAFGEKMLDEDACMMWHWDRLRKHETPEQYIERQVEKIKHSGAKYFVI